jgi:hypothetical protein
MNLLDIAAYAEVGLSSDLRPDAPRAIIIDQSRLHILADTIKNIFEYWFGELKFKATPGQSGTEALIQLLAPSWHLKSRISYEYEDEHRQIKSLTAQQFLILHMLSRRSRRAAIVGGAGTGKTMLAVELTCRLATEGLSVLFVCFNRNLAEWLEEIVKKDERQQQGHDG